MTKAANLRKQEIEIMNEASSRKFYWVSSTKFYLTNDLRAYDRYGRLTSDMTYRRNKIKNKKNTYHHSEIMLLPPVQN